jgi:hypothetical protein
MSALDLREVDVDDAVNILRRDDGLDCSSVCARGVALMNCSCAGSRHGSSGNASSPPTLPTAGCNRHRYATADGARSRERHLAERLGGRTVAPG